MRYQRLILESGSNAVTVRFHPNLTVIAGLGRLERESLLGELHGSLAGTRQGTHVELVEDTGRRLAVIRHSSGVPDRVMELESGSDVTSEFADANGKVDILANLGLDLDTVRRRSRVTSADIAVASLGDSLINRLAALDQDRLWAAADRVREADASLKDAAEGVGAAVEDAPIIEEIERRHQAFEKAQHRHESFRHHTIFTGGACAIAAIPAYFIRWYTALPFLLVAAITTAMSVIYRRRLEQAREAEREALTAAGAETYLGFHLERINQMLSDQGDRQRIADAAVEHREATEAWKALAGEDAAVDWAVASRERIAAAAQRLRAGGASSAPAAPIQTAEPAELAHALILRLNELRHLGARGESLPLVLDEPLEGLETSVKRWMLELIGRSAGVPQVVYLTADDDVAAWARIEAMAGHLSVIEPSPDHESMQALHDLS